MKMKSLARLCVLLGVCSRTSFRKKIKRSSLFHFFRLQLPVLLLFAFSQLYGQSHHTELRCGIWIKSGTPPPGTTEFMDRFGNEFTKDELRLGVGIGIRGHYPLTETSAGICNNTGVFNLNYSGSWTADEQATICQVFQDVSGIIAPGQVAPTINILITKEALSGTVGGVGTPFFEALGCGLTHTTLYNALSGAGDTYPTGFLHGTLRISPDFNFHLLVDDPTIQSTDFDLYTIALHEVFHILGIASLITDDGSSWADGSYTLWDSHLYSGEFSEYLIENDENGACCDSKIFNDAITTMPQAFHGICIDDISFYDGTSAVAIVADTDNPTPSSDPNLPDAVLDAQMANRLSHIEMDCATGETYVMDGLLLPGDISRRIPNAAELAILCQLGYGSALNANCSANTNCITIANDDSGYLYFLSEGNTATIPLSELLVNDITPDQISAGLLSGCGNTQGISVAYDPINEVFNLTLNSEGAFSFCYEVSACEGSCDEATVFITVLAEPIPVLCEPDQSCNLVCFGDFEDFIPANNQYNTQLQLDEFEFDMDPTGNLDARLNTPDVSTYFGESNQVLRLLVDYDGGQVESASIPLSSPIEPGCEVKVSFKAVYQDNGSLLDPTIKVFGLINPFSCSYVDYPYGCNSGGSAINCPLGNTMYCMTDQEFPAATEGIPITSTFEFPDTHTPHMIEYSFSWTNNTGQDISTLLFAPGSNLPTVFVDGGNTGLYIDDISVVSDCGSVITLEVSNQTSACIGEGFTATIDVCLEGDGSSPQDITLQLGQLPSGVTITGGDFNANGTATISVSPGGTCPPLTVQLNIPETYQEGTSLFIPITVSAEFSFCVDTEAGEAGISMLLEECELGLACCPDPAAIQLSNTTIAQAIIDENLPSAGTSANFCIEGVLTINQDYAFSGELYMGADARIVVEEGATLELNGAYLSGCDYLWYGIIADEANSDNSPSVYSHNGSRIEDAIFAIAASSGVVLDISSTTFNRNYIGMNLRSVSLTGFYDNTFECLGSLKPDMNSNPDIGDRSFTGIFSRGNGLLHIGVAGAARNRFFRLRNGIISERTDLLVENTEFERMDIAYTEPYDFTGHAVHATHGDIMVRGFGNGTTSDLSFNECYVGVWTAVCNVTVRQNHMERVQIGVHCERSAKRNINILYNRIHNDLIGINLSNNDPSNYIAVWNNDIYVDDYFNPWTNVGTGIQIADQGLPQNDASIEQNNIYLYRENEGIWMFAANGYSLTHNDIYLTNTNAADAEGIRGALLNDVEITCNYIEGNGIGTGYRIGNTFNSQIKCNMAYNLRTGLSIGGVCGNTFIETNTFRPPMHTGLQYEANIQMIPIQDHRGNRWLGNDTDYGYKAAVHWGSGDFDLFQSQRFEVNTLSSPLYPPSIAIPNASVPTTAWFAPAAGIAKVCNSQMECPLIGLTNEFGSIRTPEEGLAQGNYAASWPTGQHWLAEWQLYDWLTKEPALLPSSTILSTFYNTQSSGHLGTFYALTQGISTLYDIMPQETQQIEVYRQQKEVLMDALAEADSLLLHNPQATTPGLTFSFAQQINSLSSLSDALRQSITTQQYNQASSLNTTNTGGTPTAVPGINEKRVNELYLEILMQDSLSLDSLELASLYAIATQCPEDGGPAVYRARSLYNLFEYMDYSSLSCQQAAGQPTPPAVGEVINAVSAFQIFPNPSQGRFTLSYDYEQATRLDIIDPLGRSLYSQTLEAGKHNVPLVPDGLQPGLYYLSISTTDTGKPLYTEKMIITD